MTLSGQSGGMLGRQVGLKRTGSIARPTEVKDFEVSCLTDVPVSAYRPPERSQLVLLALWLGIASALSLPAVHSASAQVSGSLHTLTMSDNGTMLTIPIGDSVELRLGTNFNWNATVSDTGVLRRQPVLLMMGVQGLWNAIALGTATINATGTVVCQPGVACPALAVVWSATIVVSTQPGPPSTSVTYAPGWNIVGAPAGTEIQVDAYAWDPRAANYTLVPAGTALTNGRGYWAYFSNSTSVTLALTQDNSSGVSAPAGAWVLVGNPSASFSATVTGADIVYTWDPAAQRYTAANSLAPGAGAWAFSFAGGTLNITASQ
jgi:hypothetical protein